ncbi:hypothetical protein H5410_052538 [Solanum commersonii]|uniref:Uncharacterized protein n=1 Tax=Solanum commersonii TaxID=4109 RepID=A0A9J5X2G6_SOLCO|nr:hypothetical protein H5410_052538 [Solanum commersonii]
MFQGFYICFDAMKKSILAGCRKCIGLDGCFLKGVSKGQLLVTGLEIAITDHLPNVEHKICVRHILANWSKRWRGIKRKKYFWRCVRSTFEAELKDNISYMKRLGHKIVDH